MVFGAAAPDQEVQPPLYPVISGFRTERPRPDCPWLIVHVADSIEFGRVRKFIGLSVSDQVSVEKMKWELVTREVFQGLSGNIKVNEVIVNGIRYGPHDIRTEME